MINIVVCIDRNYVEPLGVMLNSLLQNTTAPVCIHLVHSDLTAMHFDLLNRVVGRYESTEIKSYEIGEDSFQGLAVRGHLTIVAYYLFVLPQILPQGLDKVLYLDPDMIVQSDLKPLWNVNLDQNFLAAVPVPAPYFHEMIVTEGQDYFNGGVLLINLKQWRKENLTEEAFQSVVRLKKYIARGVNQDVLNVITRNRWKKLPLLWNKCPEYFLNTQTSIYSRDELIAARGESGIIHFTGPVKPWHYACSHPRRNVYLKYKQGTPWESVPLSGKNIISFVSRMMPFYVTAWLSSKLAHTKVAEKLKKLAFG